MKQHILPLPIVNEHQPGDTCVVCGREPHQGYCVIMQRCSEGCGSLLDIDGLCPQCGRHKWGFDHTQFYAVDDWVALLYKYGVSHTPTKIEGMIGWRFEGNGILIVTLYHPVTLEHSYYGTVGHQHPGFAGYIGIESADKATVQAIVEDIRQVAYSNDESPGHREFI